MRQQKKNKRPVYIYLITGTTIKDYFLKLIFLSNKELLTTETELKAIASAAYTGVNNIPNVGYSTPAAIGIPKQL